MSLLAVTLAVIAAFGFSLAVFAYFFLRYMGKEDTVTIALTMREIHAMEKVAPAAKARAAGAA